MGWVMSQDDKSRSQTEERLSKIVQDSDMMFDLVPDALLLVDSRGVICKCNKEAGEFYGYCSEELVGSRLIDLMTKESRSVFLEKFPKLKQLQPQEGEIRVVRKDGSIIDVWRKGVPLPGKDNEFVGALVFDRDLTGYVKAKELLRILENIVTRLSNTESLDDTLRACLELTIDNTSMDSGGIYLVDGDTGDLNLCYSKGLGQVFVSSVSSYSSDHPSAKLVRKGVSFFADYSDLPMELDEERDAEGLCAIAVIPVQFKTDTIACLNVASHSLRSVSPMDRILMESIATQMGSFIVRAKEREQRVLAEEEKAKLEEQYRHSQKMEAVGRLAGGVAHDFNNILCAITGNAGLALDSISKGDPLRELVEDISAAADRASGLTRQLLAFSRKQVIAPRVVDLRDLVYKTHSMLKRLIGEDIDLQFIAPEDLGRVKIDPTQVEQVLLNLAVNARDAMPEGGKLVIELAEVVLGEDYCTTHAGTIPGHYVMLAVSDTGRGMSVEVRDKIFEPFFTTKELGQGSGFGLATVFGIVKQNHGRIEVYSEKGQGTSFKIYFPSITQKAQDLEELDVSEFVGGDETVLVVEDEDMVRKLAEKLLKRLGYEVLCAKSAADAVILSDTYDGTIHLLLTDVIMPGMNGRELATKLELARPQMKVLYTSGYTHNVIAHHGVLDEGVAFLSKPYSLETIASGVREVLDS